MQLHKHHTRKVHKRTNNKMKDRRRKRKKKEEKKKRRKEEKKKRRKEERRRNARQQITTPTNNHATIEETRGKKNQTKFADHNKDTDLMLMPLLQANISPFAKKHR